MASIAFQFPFYIRLRIRVSVENVTATDSADVPQCMTVQRDVAGTVYVTMEAAAGRQSVRAGEALKVLLITSNHR